jgi:hypothetical protein
VKGKGAIETFVCRFVLHNAVLYGLGGNDEVSACFQPLPFCTGQWVTMPHSGVDAAKLTRMIVFDMRVNVHVWFLPEE